MLFQHLILASSEIKGAQDECGMLEIELGLKTTLSNPTGIETFAEHLLD